MSSVLILIAISFVAAGVIYLAFYKYRTILRNAKGIERGLKMVPMIIHLPPASDDTEIGSRDVRDVVEEKISQAESLYSVIATTAKKGFWSRFYGQRHIAFEIVATAGTVEYYVAVPVPMLAVVQQAVLSAYPSARLEEAAEHNIFNPTGKLDATVGGEMHLKKEYAYPIATFRESRRDAMQTILNALGTLEEGDGASIQLLLRPAKEGWEKASTSLAAQKRKDKGKKPGVGGAVGSSKDLLSALWKPPETQEVKQEDKELSTMEQSILDAVEQKTRSSGYEVLIRVVASAGSKDKAQAVLSNVAAAFALFDSPSLNGFSYTPAKDMEKFITAFIFRFFPPEKNKDILNSTELATVFHFPDSRFTPTSQLQRQESKQVDGPRDMPERGLLFGYNLYRGVKKEIHLSEEDRRRHTYIVGQTGTGKSQLLENLALQDMIAGKGFAFIDPHGDAVESLLAMVPKDRTEDIIYFNPGDMEHPLGLNLFEFDTPEQKDFLIQETINMLYKLYDPQHQGIIGPRYEHWFRNAALTLMSDPAGATFIEIPKVFTDKQYLREKLKYVKDPTVLDFWNKEMAQTSDYHKSEVLGWFVSKFGAFMSNEMMRNIIGQVKSSFDLKDVMNNRKILLVNLSKGKVGELNSMLLGMIFVMKFQAAAMSRAHMDESERKDFSLYVDEFQNFSTDSFATILSEARKYRLNLIVANQFIGQLTEEIRDAVFGNVGTTISFRSGASDADFLSKQFSPTFETQDLITLPNFTAIVRMMINGVPSQPFNMVTLPRLGQVNHQLNTALKQLSAAKYGKPKGIVERAIFKRMESKAPPMRPGRPGAGSSFLDDWLAKRKRQNQSNPVSPAPTQASGKSRHEFLRQSQVDPGKPLPRGSDGLLEPMQNQSKGTLEHDNRLLRPGAANSQAPQGAENQVSDDRVQNQNQTQAPTDAKKLKEDSGTVPDLVNVDNVASVLKHKLADSGAKPAQKQPGSDKPVSKPSMPAAKGVPSLKPGEIYIDDEGVVHRAAGEEDSDN